MTDTDEAKGCGLCGNPAKGFAEADGVRLCHGDTDDISPGGTAMTCYHRWTVYGQRPDTDDRRDMHLTEGDKAMINAQFPDVVTDTEEAVERLAKAMQQAWNEWCADTGCVPDAFHIRGPDTTRVEARFSGSSFVDHVAQFLAAADGGEVERLRAVADAAEDCLADSNDFPGWWSAVIRDRLSAALDALASVRTGDEE